MKKNIFYLLMLFVFFIGACKEDEVSYYDLGSEFVIDTKNITSLDNSVVLNVTAFNITGSIAVKHNGGILADGETEFTAANPNLGSITIADGEGSLTIPEANLGMDGVGASADLVFTYTLGDGTVVNRFLTVDYLNPFTVKNTYKPLLQFDKALGYVFDIKTGNAPITSITVEKKTNFNGVYVDVPDAINGTYAAKDSVMVNGKDYLGGVDTIYLKITANTAVKTSIKTVKLPVGIYAYTSKASIKLTPTTPALTKSSLYDFQKRRFIPNSRELTSLDSVDIKFNYLEVVPGNFTIGFDAPNNAEFVKTTSTFYNNGDIVKVKAFDFSTAVDTYANLLKDDVFVYRTKRGAGAYTYGLLKVVSVTKAESGINDSYVTFELKY